MGWPCAYCYTGQHQRCIGPPCDCDACPGRTDVEVTDPADTVSNNAGTDPKATRSPGPAADT